MSGISKKTGKIIFGKTRWITWYKFFCSENGLGNSVLESINIREMIKKM